MADKKPPSAEFRRTLYWDTEMESQVNQLAKRLKKEGVDGLYNLKGEVNRTAVIRTLLARALDGEKAG